MPVKPNPLPSMDTLNSLFEFKDGVLYNKPNRPYPAKAGQPVGHLGSKGYLYVEIKRKKYLIHRVIFFMHHKWCPDYIDHINGVVTDNRIDNLRPASEAQNAYNRSLGKNNTSGYKGICKKANGWIAQIWYGGRYKHLGSFVSKELAIEFLELARDMVHGDYANHGTFRSI